MAIKFMLEKNKHWYICISMMKNTFVHQQYLHVTNIVQLECASHVSQSGSVPNLAKWQLINSCCRFIAKFCAYTDVSSVHSECVSRRFWTRLACILVAPWNITLELSCTVDQVLCNNMTITMKMDLIISALNKS